MRAQSKPVKGHLGTHLLHKIQEETTVALLPFGGFHCVCLNQQPLREDAVTNVFPCSTQIGAGPDIYNSNLQLICNYNIHVPL